VTEELTGMGTVVAAVRMKKQWWSHVESCVVN
jgi:hypothetical protein